MLAETSQPTPVPPTSQNFSQNDSAPVQGFWDWLVTLIMLAIPVLNLVMLVIWSTDKYTNPNKANFAKASLVIIGLQVLVAIFFIGVLIGSMHSVLSQFSQSGLWK